MLKEAVVLRGAPHLDSENAKVPTHMKKRKTIFIATKLAHVSGEVDSIISFPQGYSSEVRPDRRRGSIDLVPSTVREMARFGARRSHTSSTAKREESVLTTTVAVAVAVARGRISPLKPRSE